MKNIVKTLGVIALIGAYSSCAKKANISEPGVVREGVDFRAYDIDARIHGGVYAIRSPARDEGNFMERNRYNSYENRIRQHMRRILDEDKQIRRDISDENFFLASHASTTLYYKAVQRMEEEQSNPTALGRN